MFKSKIDWMGEYNKLLEAKGESSRIGCLMKDLKSAEVINHDGNHTQMDGLSCLIEGLRENGFSIPAYPRVKFSKKLSVTKKISLTIGFLAKEFFPVKKIQWKHDDPASLRTFGPFTHSFDLEATLKIKKNLRSSGAVMPSALLYAIDKSISESLLVKKSINRWYVPFNMRGLYQGPTEKSNHISNFILQLDDQDNVASIHRKTLAELKTGSFLVNFFFLNLGNYWPFRNALRDKVETDYKKQKVSEKMIGSCTYLGEWSPENHLEMWQHKVLLPFGNVSLKNPISFTAILWRGQLAFSLQVHASIIRNDEAGQSVLNRAIEILKGIANE